MSNYQGGYYTWLENTLCVKKYLRFTTELQIRLSDSLIDKIRLKTKYTLLFNILIMNMTGRDNILRFNLNVHDFTNYENSILKSL